MSENITQCTYCLKPIDKVYINCNECQNVVLCLGCFCNGVESNLHKKHHGYCVKTSQVQNHLIFEGWSESEELKLLDAIEQYGVGNWEDVSFKVETRSPEECLAHYCNYYLNGLFGQQLLNSSRYPSHVTDHTGDMMSSTLSPSVLHSPPPIQLDIEDQHLLGYMPYRDDFERDYDNDAESILCRLHPSFSHDDLEDALKVAQVTIYLQRLRERQRRKEIAREHGLISHILAYILNKRVKKRYKKSNDNPIDSSNKRRGRPPIGRKTSISKGSSTRSPLKRSPISRQFSDTSTHMDDDVSTLPPPGSWLAVPFVLQSYGAKRGTPIVVNGLPDVNVNSIPGASNNPSHQSGLAVRDGGNHNTDNMNVFFLSEKLKPFLRYFTGTQGKTFMDSLHTEEVLKHEIKHLLELRTKGKVKLNAFKLKYPPLRSSVYCPPPRNTGPVSSQSEPVSQVKKKRRNPTTPWYLKVQRKAKQLR